MSKNKNYKSIDSIKIFKSSDNITNNVVSFYKDDPFPNYELTDNKLSILEMRLK